MRGDIRARGASDEVLAMRLPFPEIKRRATLALLTVLYVALPSFAQPSVGVATNFTFDDMTPGEPPEGFTTALTGRGGPSIWTVEAVAGGSQALVQMSAERTGQRFPVCVLDGFAAADVDLSVRFQPISGETDQAAGLVWRYAEADNYYVVRANALENNVVLYKMENGRRSDLRPIGASILAYGQRAPVLAGEWSTLRVTARGSRFSVHLNGEHLYDVEDATFTDAGKVGLWTKADSVTRFDDFAVATLAPE
jgi:hypothetical protein